MAFASEGDVKSLLKKNGIPMGKSYGPWKGRKYGAEVGGFGDDHPMYPGWIQVGHVLSGGPNNPSDPDVPKNSDEATREHFRGMKEAHYHQILTGAGFEHQVVPNFPRTMNLYRKVI